MANFDKVKHLIADVAFGKKHHTLNCITFTPALRSICGFSMEQFALLFNMLTPALQESFSNSPLISHEPSKICEIRFKLFICLFHLKMALPYKAMEAIFGWAKSSIEEWCSRIRHIICKLFKPLRNVLKYLGQRWQYEKAQHFNNHFDDSSTHPVSEYRLFDAVCIVT